jgi:hypothetical protein
MDISDQLRRLMDEADDDPSKEPDVWKAMLDAVLYAHVPHEDKPGYLRFVQFVRPDNGQMVLPFFSDRQKAIEAAGGQVKVLPLLGRNLFTYTRGATLMLDPNERGCVFYPEEIEALLAGSPLAAVQPWEANDGQVQVMFEPAGDLPAALIAGLQDASKKLPTVTSVHVAHVRWDNAMEQPALLIGIVAEKLDHEHAMRAIATAIQPSLDALDYIVDLTLITPSKSADHQVVHHGTLVYSKNPQAPDAG